MANGTWQIAENSIAERKSVKYECARCLGHVEIDGDFDTNQAVECPHCLASAPLRPLASGVLAPVVRSAVLVAVPPPVPAAVLTKTCPFCAEQVAAAAKKCKHCGETIDVTLRAAEEAQRASARQPTVYMNAASAAAAAVSMPKHRFPHLMHFLVTLVTVGFWLPVWILHYLFRDRNYYW